MKPLISIVAPMYNEQELAEVYCKEMLVTLKPLSVTYDFELVLVNDGSGDGTLDEMIRMQALFAENITVISLSRNFGLEGAVHAGLRKAAGGAIIVMDADLQDPPALVLEMIVKWEKGADIVTASRIKRRNDNLFKRFTANIYYKILNGLAGKLKLEKSAANFRLLSRKALEILLDLPEVNAVFRVIVPFVGLKQDVVIYERDKRFAGKTKYNLKSMIRYALDSLTGISIEPLRKIAWTVPITFVFLMSFFCGIIFSEGFWRVGFTIMFVMGLFFCVAIIGEYIGQIMTEAKGRPVLIIETYKPSINAQRRS